jgi:hypothetical protein
MFITRFLSNLELTNPVKNQAPTRIMHATQVRAWIPPPSGTVKINVDGAMSRSGKIGAVSAVCLMV